METLKTKLARETKPGYKPQRRRTVLGLVLVQVNGAAWKTEDGAWAIESDEQGGWLLWGKRPNGAEAFLNLKGAALEVLRLRALVAAYEAPAAVQAPALEGPAYTLLADGDAEPCWSGTLAQFQAGNEDLFGAQEMRDAADLEVGGTQVFGGGAGVAFTLQRVR